MHDSVHQHQHDQYPRDKNREGKELADNEVANPRPKDVTEDENIVEVEESARSEEGIGSRDDGLQMNMDVKEDREDNSEGRLPDIPPSAIIR